MASKKTIDIINNYIDKNIIDENLENIVGQRFGLYSKYIIQERAIPDARDGLKPVQRRILYGMYKMGLYSNKPYKKSARIVGEVMGKYHPHGDTSIYEALIRLSQDFKTNLQLIDMHGNNGSIDGDSAAAMRYTETRLSKESEYLLQDIFKNTVIFVPNFDDEEYEPTVLPAKFPNLLVNGTTGISSGYATDIPPHNIVECIDAVLYRMDNPNCTIEDLMTIIKGPDFPTGGVILGNNGIKQAYNTGRGKIKIRSIYHIEHNTVYITEIPFEVNKATLVKRIDEIARSKNIQGIHEVRDESDRMGLTIAIDLNKNCNSEVVMNYLFKHTDLQKNYSFNMTAIANKRPVLMSLDMILDTYITHQKDVITNRCNFELDKAKTRQNIVSGLIKMVSILDEVIKVIRNSNNKSNAKKNLCEQFDFGEEQAEAIVTLQLYRLSNTDILDLNNEEDNLESEIKKLKNILSSQTELIRLIEKELKNTKKDLARDRKTDIIQEESTIVIDEKDLIPDERTIISVTKHGYVKRTSYRSYNSSKESDIGIKDDDFPILIGDSSTLDTLLVFTDKGNYIYQPVYNLPEIKWKDMGAHISNIVTINSDENVIYAKIVKNFDLNLNLLICSRKGKIKIVKLKDLDVTRYTKKIKYITLAKNDMVASVVLSKPKSHVFVITNQSAYIKYLIEEVSFSTTTSKGITAINMKNSINDYVVSACYIGLEDDLILLTTRGNIIRKDSSEIEIKHRINKPELFVSLVKSNPHDILSCFSTSKEEYKNKLKLELISNNKEQINLFDIKYYSRSEYGTNVYNGSKDKLIGLYRTEREIDDEYFKECITEAPTATEEITIEKEIENGSMFIENNNEKLFEPSKETKEIDIFDILDEKPDLEK